MSGGMAIARTLSNLDGQDVLRSVTHLGGNSGGTFFGTQLVHSPEFFKNVTSSSIPLDTVVNDWLDAHIANLKELMRYKSELEAKWGPVGLLPQEPGCVATNLINRFLFNTGMDLAEFPLRWLPLTGGAVLSHTIPASATVTYATANRTLPQVVQINTVTLPSDAYGSHDPHTRRTNVSTLQLTFKNGTELNLAKLGRALPIAYISEESSQNNGWSYNDDISKLSLIQRCPYEGLEAFRCKHAPWNTNHTTPLELPKDPLLAEVAAASGGGAGFAGSPTAYSRISKKVISMAPWPLQPELWEVASCWPFGAQALAPPMLQQGADALHAEDSVGFRYMDGGYAENTALAMTIAKVQRDCAAGLFECDEPITAILVNDGNSTANRTGTGMFVANDPLHSLFTNHQTPSDSWVPGMFASVEVPSQAIFEEPFPTKGWMPYNNFPSTTIWGADGGKPTKQVKHNITSHFWSGELTTIENKYYKVSAGTKVKLLVFSLDIPGVLWPGLFDPKQSSVESPGHIRMVDGEVTLDRDLLAGHAPMAKAQSIAMEPVLREFLSARLRTVLLI
jgi:hypothetical protein